MTPIGFIADFLGFLFLYNTGLKQLKSGLRNAHAESIKSLLTVFLIISTAQLIPSFLFDSSYHFGSMWSFFFPVLLFTRWSQTNKDATIASSICDTFFAQLSTIIHGFYPDAWKGDQGQSFGIIVGVVVILLFWVGYLGSTGSFLTIWFFLAISTINTIGEYVPDQTTQLEYYRTQQTIWHNLLAIWMFRFLISTLESISIPGLVSLLDVVLHHLPSYFLWITIFLFAMLLTKKTVDDTTKVADTWYARWLLGTRKSAPVSSQSTTTAAPVAQTKASSSHGSSSRSHSKKP
ncbi:hypothetical protein BCR39DRAFT_490578 [Naematelia encephala]|uniref:Uncharacterized protein n=1 Tax=Naematelia encephala TaxID=71784 RepID=A0A1Y2BJI7_9TREE|nr:hypothetical protein BCR39DRAFT_490578 [Naematelia encephala]